MKTIKVFFQNPADNFSTNFNGTDSDIREYYIGHGFNVGDGHGGDRMAVCVGVEIEGNPRIFAADAPEKAFRVWQNNESARLVKNWKNFNVKWENRTIDFDKFCLEIYTGRINAEGAANL